MPSVSTIEQIEHPRDQVYAAGIQAETWPEVTGLVIKTDDPTIALGGIIRAQLHIPGIKLGLDCVVTDLVPNERVGIVGRSRAADAWLGIELSDVKLSDDRENDGTQIEFTLDLKPKNLITRAASPVLGAFVQTVVPVFASDFKRNINGYITGEASTTL